MKKRLTIILALVMLLSSLPAQVFADGGNEPIQGGDVEIIEKKLAAPTELEWNKYNCMDPSSPPADAVGAVSWKCTVKTGNMYFDVRFYLADGTPIADDCVMVWPGEEYFSSTAFLEEDFDTGNYYFTVQAICYDDEFESSEIAVSALFAYVRPSERIEKPVILSAARSEAEYGIGAHGESVLLLESQYLFSTTEDGEYRLCSSCLTYMQGGFCSNMNMTEQINSFFYEPGYYKVKIRAISGDALNYRSSEWSEPCEPIWFDGVFIISYDAAEGTNAPAAQQRGYDEMIYLSTDVPQREGYDFLGWNVFPAAVLPEFAPGDEFGIQGDYTLYAVWQEKAPSADPAVGTETVTGFAGREVTVPITITDNPGIAAMVITLTYDTDKLELISCDDGLMKDWTVNPDTKSAVWVDSANVTENGTIANLRFNIISEGEGFASVEVTYAEALSFAEETVFVDVRSGGGVNIRNNMPGDLTGDGKVDAIDLLRMKKVLTNFDVEYVAENADVTNDGKLGADDLLRLKKYLVGFDVELIGKVQ